MVLCGRRGMPGGRDEKRNGAHNGGEESRTYKEAEDRRLHNRGPYYVITHCRMCSLTCFMRLTGSSCKL